MEESILTSIKKLLGLPEEVTQFDLDITIHINTVFVILNQLGVGPDTGFEITDATTKWSDYLQANKLLNDVKTYTYLKVRLIFDPPASSAVIESMKSLISELEFRIPTTVDESRR